MAAQALEKHQPNLLLIHLVETDHVQHRVGPQTDDAYWSVTYADDRLRDLIEAVERFEVRKNNDDLRLQRSRLLPVAKDIRPNVRLKQLGLLETEGEKIATRSRSPSRRGRVRRLHPRRRAPRRSRWSTANGTRRSSKGSTRSTGRSNLPNRPTDGRRRPAGRRPVALVPSGLRLRRRRRATSSSLPRTRRSARTAIVPINPSSTARASSGARASRRHETRPRAQPRHRADDREAPRRRTAERRRPPAAGHRH